MVRVVRNFLDFFPSVFPGFEILRMEAAAVFQTICAMHTNKRWFIVHLLAPIPVTPGHAEGHLPKVCHFLSLEAVQVRLDSGT